MHGAFTKYTNICRYPKNTVKTALSRRAGGGPAEPNLPVPAEEEGGEDGGGRPPRLCHLLLTPTDTHGGGHL
jgi:hypothetical protein